MDSATVYQLANDAIKQCHSVLALSRSPLAATPLIAPALVLDELSPTADERGRALRVVLNWAVAQLAPSAIAYPAGVFRPWDDPTWRDPHWWRYNILRHRYLEPLPPDDFVEGGRYMETLLALTGISSIDTLYDERNRAVRSVAEILQQQMATRAADAELQRMALVEVLGPLAGEPVARTLLSMAAIFDDIFPRVLLLQMADDEGVTEATSALERLIERRYLLSGDKGANLWLAAPLRTWFAPQEPRQRAAARHRFAARYFRNDNDPLPAVRHLQAAGQWGEAAELLLCNWALAEEWKSSTLRDLLKAFPAGRLPPERWRAVQLQLADLESAAGASDAAIAACRAALKASGAPAAQAQCYRRLGKLYEKRNPIHARSYYRHAEERFPADDPELVILLKDRGWLHILRGAWLEAAHDLERALALAPSTHSLLRADVLDALASLSRNQGQLATAIDYAQQALGLREELGDLPQVAKSLGNLGLLYARTEGFAHALAAHREAMDIYARIGNRELVATAWLNIGMTQHLAGDRLDAVNAYRNCLQICREVHVPLAEVKALYNLVEAELELGEHDGACSCWLRGNELAHLHAFDDQVRYFETLAREHPALTRLLPTSRPVTPYTPFDADPESVHALEIARRNGQVTPRALMEEASVSKATATRRLGDLVLRGLLVKHGDGRSTVYRLPSDQRSQGTGALAAQIARLQTELTVHYRLVELQIVDESHWRGGIQLAARFAQVPELKRFFELEAQLAAALGQPVDLVPVDL